MVVKHHSEHDDARVTDLALRAGRGDRAALTEFIKSTQDDVWRLLAHLGGPEIADDLTQETYLRVIGALPALLRVRRHAPGSYPWHGGSGWTTSGTTWLARASPPRSMRTRRPRPQQSRIQARGAIDRRTCAYRRPPCRPPRSPHPHPGLGLHLRRSSQDRRRARRHDSLARGSRSQGLNRPTRLIVIEPLQIGLASHRTCTYMHRTANSRAPATAYP